MTAKRSLSWPIDPETDAVRVILISGPPEENIARGYSKPYDPELDAIYMVIVEGE